MNQDNSPKYSQDIKIDHSVMRVFESTNAVTIIQAFLPSVSSPDILSRTHIHQFGIFGFSFIGASQMSNATTLLAQASGLALSFVNWVKTPPDFPNEPTTSSTSTDRRVPKLWIATTEEYPNILSKSVQNSIIFQLKHSDFCHQILGLCGGDIIRWKQEWAETTLDERTMVETLGNKYFGVSKAIYPGMTFLQIFVIMSSPNEPRDTTFLRVSVGIDSRRVPNCSICERDVVSFDWFNPTSVAQLNIPLSKTFTTPCNPSELLLSKSVYDMPQGHTLKGWYADVPCKRRRDEPKHEPCSAGFNIPVVPDYWDPMATSEPDIAFQSHPLDFDRTVHLCKKRCFDRGSEEAEFRPDATHESGFDPVGDKTDENLLSDSDSDSGFSGFEACEGI
jgi:hypothetical protein